MFYLFTLCVADCVWFVENSVEFCCWHVICTHCWAHTHTQYQHMHNRQTTNTRRQLQPLVSFVIYKNMHMHTFTHFERTKHSHQTTDNCPFFRSKCSFLFVFVFCYFILCAEWHLVVFLNIFLLLYFFRSSYN